MPPAGHGIKGKGTKLPVPVIFSGQSLHLLSNWEPGQEYKPERNLTLVLRLQRKGGGPTARRPAASILSGSWTGG